MSKIVRVLLALAALGVVAACTTSSGANNATNIRASTSSPAAPKLGTEIIEGSTSGPDLASLTVKASGVFADTGTLKLPIGNPRTITFSFTRGKLMVLNATGPTSGPRHVRTATCAFSQASAGTYRVLSGGSTGSYAGATGHGSYAFSSSGIAPKAASGGCEMSSKATPGKALFTIRLRGPLVLNEGN
jgi:hypothetical protein